MQIGSKMIKVYGINLVTFENILLGILITCVGYLASETLCHQKKKKKSQTDFSPSQMFYSLFLVLMPKEMMDGVSKLVITFHNIGPFTSQINTKKLTCFS